MNSTSGIVFYDLGTDNVVFAAGAVSKPNISSCSFAGCFSWHSAFCVGLQQGSALQISLDLCIPEKELAKTRSQISFIYFQSHLNSGPLHHQPVFYHQTKEDTLNWVTMQILISTRVSDVWSAGSSPLGRLYVSVISRLYFWIELAISCWKYIFRFWHSYVEFRTEVWLLPFGIM